jgi:hypothetical protein
MAFNFQELFMKFSLEGKEIELRGITGKSSKVISSNGMTKLLKKGHQGIIAQLCSLTTTYCKNYDVLFAALWTKLSILSQNRENL